MKKIIFSIFASAALLFASCDADRQIFDSSGENYAYFTGGTSFKLPVKVEDTDGTEMLLEVGSTVKTNADRAVRIEILADEDLTDDVEYATEDQYSIDATTLVIPADSYIGKIKLKSYYNELPEQGSVFVKVKLTAVDGNSLMESSSIYTVELFRSCPKEIGLDYTVYPSRTGGSALPTYNTTIIPIQGEENTYRVSSSWGPNAVATLTGSASYNGQYLYESIIVINCDNTITVEGTDPDLPGGTGTYDPESGFITLVLTQELFTTAFTVTSVFIPR